MPVNSEHPDRKERETAAAMIHPTPSPEVRLAPERRSRRRKERPSSSPRSAVRKKKEKADGRTDGRTDADDARTHGRTQRRTEPTLPHSPSLVAESGKSSRKVIIFR